MDQGWNGSANRYLGVRRPARMQQAACIYGVKESVRAAPMKLAGRPVILSKGFLFGQDVLVGGPGAHPGVNSYYGDARCCSPSGDTVWSTPWSGWCLYR